MPIFPSESSQTRKRAYTRTPTRFSEMNFSVGAWLPATVVVTVVVVVLVPTRSDGPEAAVVWPFDVCAVTSARMRLPVSAERTPYDLPVAPATFRQPVPSLAHRCHWYVNDDALGLQAPFVTVSVLPGMVLPEIAGLTVLVGPFAEPMTSVGSDVADAEPSAFFAVTTTRIVWWTDVDVSVYVWLVAPTMSPHAVPSVAQRRHW